MAGFHCYHPHPIVVGGTLELSSTESHHLVAVLRVRTGAVVTLFDGSGCSWEGTLQQADKRNATVAIVSENEPQKPSYELGLAQALPKGKLMESIVRRAVEIGVTQIYPLLTERTEIQGDAESFKKKEQRWHLAAIEACKQSGNYLLPTVNPIQAIEDFLSSHRMGPRAFGMVGSLEPQACYLKQALAKHEQRPEGGFCLIGPEGDFTPEEYKQAYAKGFAAIRLSDPVLRSETAAIYALSILNNALKENYAVA